MNVLLTYGLTGPNASKLHLHLCPVPRRRSHQANTKHHLITKLTGIFVQNSLHCSCGCTACREEGSVHFICQLEGRLNQVARPYLFETLPWLSSHLSGEFWARRDCFLSAALLADATSLIRLSRAGTHDPCELAAFPSPGALLAQHYLHASAAK